MGLLKFAVVCASWLFSVFVTTAAYAELLISPTRVDLADRERVQELILVNTAESVRSYRLEWQESAIDAQGKQINLDHTPEYAVSPFTRFTPRQVTLQPGERQIVKVVVRAPGKLPAAEYRSHLLFRAIPVKSEASDPANTGIKLNLLLSYSLPVIYRVDPQIATVQLVPGSLTLSQQGKGAKAVFELSRQGAYGSFGNLRLYWQATPASEKQLIAVRNEYSLYPEEHSANVSIPLLPEAKLPTAGLLTLEYDGAGRFSGQQYFSTTLSL